MLSKKLGFFLNFMITLQRKNKLFVMLLRKRLMWHNSLWLDYGCDFMLQLQLTEQLCRLSHSFSLFKFYSPHCNLLPIWTTLTTQVSLQKDDSNNQNGTKGIKVSCLLPVAWPYRQANTGTEKKEERWSHRAERGTASLQHCPCYLPQSHKEQFKSTCLYKFFWASPKKILLHITSHSCKIQFIHNIHKTSESWLIKTEEKSTRQAEHQAWHTQERTLRPSHPITFTLCQSWR